MLQAHRLSRGAAASLACAACMLGALGTSPARAVTRQHVSLEIGGAALLNHQLQEDAIGVPLDQAGLGGFGYRYALNRRLELTFDAMGTSAQVKPEWCDDATLWMGTLLAGPGVRFYPWNVGVRPFVQGSVLYVSEFVETKQFGAQYSETRGGAGFALATGCEFRASRRFSVPVRLQYHFAKPADDVSGVGITVGFACNFGDRLAREPAAVGDVSRARTGSAASPFAITPSLPPDADTTWEEVRYNGGPLRTSVDPHDWDNTLTVSPRSIRFETRDGQVFGCSPAEVTRITYGQAVKTDVARTAAACALVPGCAPFILGALLSGREKSVTSGVLPQQRLHTIGIEYARADATRGALVIQASQENHREILLALVRATGKDVVASERDRRYLNSHRPRGWKQDRFRSPAAGGG